jgi:hypothetical protein
MDHSGRSKTSLLRHLIMISPRHIRRPPFDKRFDRLIAQLRTGFDMAFTSPFDEPFDKLRTRLRT